jgi:glycosyltransferase involved in cell wall biosynthesis
MKFQEDITPELSVLMSVYNDSKYIKEAINSILNQTYQDFEIVIMNDGSNDNTEEIILNYNHPKIKYFASSENKGLAVRLNEGIQYCRGNYIARMDADDISLPNRFELQLQFLKTNEEYVLVGSAYYKIVDKENKVIRKQVSEYSKLKTKLLFGNNIAHPSVMFNKKIWLQSNCLYDETFRYAQDYELWTRLILNYKIANLKEPLIFYRRYEGVSSEEKIAISTFNFMKAQSQYIKSVFGIKDIEKTRDLSFFFSQPKKLKLIQGIKIYLVTISQIFNNIQINKVHFFLRCTNQMIKIFRINLHKR